MTKAIVLYNSRGGNTRNVAMKIAEGLGVECRDNKNIPENIEEFDLLVLGTWPMMFKVSSAGRRWLKKFSKRNLNGKKIALFFTSAGPDEDMPKAEDTRKIKEMVFETMENIISKNNDVTILEERFYCKGALRMMGKITANEGHPTEEELTKAKEFGEMLKSKSEVS